MEIRRYLQALVATMVLVMVASACTRSGTSEIAGDHAAANTPSNGTFNTDVNGGQPTPGRDEAMTEEPAAVDPAPATTRERAVAVDSLRDVDFQNGFTYETLLEFGSPLAVVQDGFFDNGSYGDDDFYSFSVRSPTFGDLDGDGVEEAALVTSWNGGGTGHFDSVRVYRLVNGRPERAGIVAFGDRAHGGVQRTRIVDGTVRVWFFADGNGACCPNQIAQATLVLGQHAVVEVARSDARTWDAPTSDAGAIELQFLPATSSAYLTAYTWIPEGVVSFEASAGQLFQLTLLEGPQPDVVLTDTTTGARLDPWRTVLPTTGGYELSTGFTTEPRASAQLVLRIGDDGSQPNLSWAPALDQRAVDDARAIASSVAWPVFESVQPGTAAVNASVAAYVTTLGDEWLAEADEWALARDGGGSSYELSYAVALATEDLASVTFNYYDNICCRPYPNYGSRGVVVDFAAGRILPVDEILDLSRADEIFAMWADQLVADQDFAAGFEFVGELAGTSTALDAVVVTPQGVEFRTDRGELAGGAISTITLLTWAQLGDLVDSTIAARAQQ